MTNKILDCKEAAAYLTEVGVKTSPGTLDKLACIGGGPVFRKSGRRRIYITPDLDAYARSKISAPMRSTSDSEVGAAA